MMKITLFETGKTRDANIAELTRLYTDRIKHYAPFEIHTLPDIRTSKKMSNEQVKEREGELILREVGEQSFVVLLDENGKEFTSTDYAKYLQGLMNRGLKNLSFIIGGPYGFSEAVYLRADAKLSLSKMTMSHQLIRPVFTEQLYRAFTILRNEPYHHS